MTAAPRNSKATPANEAPLYACSRCGAQGKGRKVKGGGYGPPMRWPKVLGRLLCKDCDRTAFAKRAVEVRIVGPAAKGEADWQALRAALRTGFGQATAIVNAATTELYVRDVRRTPEMKQLPKHEIPYLYPVLRARFPDAASGLIVACAQRAMRCYRAKRYDLLWLGKCSLPDARYPQPYVVPTGWRIACEDERYYIYARIAGQTFRLIVAGGKDFAYAKRRIEQIVGGLAQASELSFREVAARNSDGRNGSTDNSPGRPVKRLLAKIAARFPVAAGAGKEKLLELRTAGDYLLVGLLAGRDDPLVWSGDRPKQWYFSHERRSWRASLDAKHERRRPKRRGKRCWQEFEDYSRKYRDRMNSFVAETVAEIAGVCRRNKVTHVTYDDEKKDYLPGFIWHRLRTSLASRLLADGVQINLSASDEAQQETADSLAVDANGELDA